MADELVPRILAVLAATFGVPAPSLDGSSSSATIPGWDSLNHIHLMIALEGEFGVSFEPEQAVELTSVRAIEQAIVAAR